MLKSGGLIIFKMAAVRHLRLV